MKFGFRWYGKNDTIPLNYIKQIPVINGVVTAVYDVKPGIAWGEDTIRKLYEDTKAAGLKMEVIESVPVHEDIKLGKVTRDKYIAAYILTLKRLSAVGVNTVCYNFMPVFDWVRTDLSKKNSDGSNCLSYCHDQILKLDPKKLSLPGWDESYSPNELQGLLEQYKSVTREKLFENLVYFLNAIMPVCEKVGINMAIHADDPPWDLFGLPRIISTEADLDKLFAAVPNKPNGVTLCTGSFGASKDNDLCRMAEKYSAAKRIFFVHLRNIKRENDYDFYESAHCTFCGDVDMYQIVKILHQNNFDGYIRPDHGRNIFGESGKPGYGLYDRALGAMYLYGMYEAISRA